MSDYSELQKKASSLGITSVGVKKEELERLVAEAEGKVATTSTPEPVEPVEPVEEKPKKNKTSHNAAHVYEGRKLVRTYSIESHGKDFADLAEEFANRSGYIVEYVTIEPKIKCPSCGHNFRP